jgi:hypothetical protein
MKASELMQGNRQAIAKVDPMDALIHEKVL